MLSFTFLLNKKVLSFVLLVSVLTLLFHWMPVWYFFVYSFFFGFCVFLFFFPGFESEFTAPGRLLVLRRNLASTFGKNMFMAPIHALWPVLFSAFLNLSWFDSSSKFFLFPLLIFLILGLLFHAQLILLPSDAADNFDQSLKKVYLKVWNQRKQLIPIFLLVLLGLVAFFELIRLISFTTEAITFLPQKTAF